MSSSDTPSPASQPGLGRITCHRLLDCSLATLFLPYIRLLVNGELSGNEARVAMLGPGDWVGEMSIIDATSFTSYRDLWGEGCRLPAW